MGSFQQISLGIICLVGAFAFGTYVNNHPAGGQPAVSTNGSLLDGNLSSQPGNVQSRLPLDELETVSKRPAPIATMRNPLPPPSQLSFQQLPDGSQPSMSMPTQQQNADSNPSPGVQIPDFSMIAAEFKNTPIELPPLGETRSDSNPTSNSQLETPAVTLKQLVKKPEMPRIGSPSNPDQPTREDRWNLTAPSKLSADDFAPKLKSRFSDPTMRDRDAPADHSALLANEDSPVPAAIGVTPKQNQLPLARDTPNDSLDEFQPIAAMNRAEPPARVAALPREQFRTPTGTLDTSVPYAGGDIRSPGTEFDERQTSNRVRSKLPFGLNHQSKGELARLRSNADSKIALPTTRFVDHVVQSGESLQSISTRYFGKPDFYLDIYLANRNKLRNPADVPPGITVRVPMYE